ncbi:unnamed protein product, partial [marine sediment metagenome]
MAQNDDVKVLKVVLIIAAVSAFVYGFGLLFVPGLLVKLGGTNPVEFGWLRWMGGLAIALGIGCLMVSSKPENR